MCSYRYIIWAMYMSICTICVHKRKHVYAKEDLIYNYYIIQYNPGYAFPATALDPSRRAPAPA
jgi:hypothetical protein